MIGDATLGRSFKDLASYLEHGPRDQLEPPDRVDWVESRNLPTSHPQASARIMAATARDSERTEKPVYHLIISFDPNDPVNRATMRQVADRTLRDLGLSEHQALIVAHKDRAHAHLHIMVNRVHPEDRTAWSNSWDYGRIERSLREQEKAHGLRVVPGKHSREPGRERAPALVRGDAAFLRTVQRDAGPHLAQARSWAELERGLAGHGLSIRVHNGGFVFTDGVRKVKASEVDRAASRKNLERRLGSLGAYRARQAVAGRTLDERAARVAQHQVQHRTPPAPAAPELRPAPARAPDPVRIPPAKIEHRRIAESYRESLARLYLAPHRAHAQFREALVRDGREAAVRTLRENPRAFGLLRGTAETAPQRARDAAGEAYRWSGRVEAGHRLDLRRAALAFREHEAIRTFTGAQKAVEDARGTLTHQSVHRDYVRAHARHLVRDAGDVYQRPREALHNIARSVRRIGADRTADLIHGQPERFGSLQSIARKRYLGLATEYDTSRAREAAHALSGHLRGMDFNRDHAAKAGEVLRTRTALEAAQKRLAMLPQRAGTAFSHAAEMRRVLERAGKVVNLLERAGVDVASRLVPMLPAQAVGLVRQAAGIARELGMGRDPERDRGRDRGGWSL